MSQVSKLKKQLRANLRTTIKITFHTQYALNLIEGTDAKKHPHKFFIIGLLGFASKIKTVKREADNKNPYARYYYQQAEIILDKAKVFFEKTHQECEATFKDAENVGITLSIAETENPVEREFSFKVDLCYQAVILLAKYDICIRKLQAAKQTGFMSNNATNNKIEKMSKLMRQLFHSLEPYKNHSVTIEDIKEGNEKAKLAYEAMGVIPGLDLDKLIYATPPPPL
ncbi:PFL_4669 family integrating conjugative element protein [Aliikangiella maris]|uniref:PFL_4669 family integrating conjugative element protein n=2 Tax=Aliikangiella maris TaxID=3162458 RepID=A0ABV3MTQ9_9GAMM